MFKDLVHTLFFLLLTKYGHTTTNLVHLTNDCSCPGHNLTIECTVTGVVDGSTVWRGNAFQTLCMIPEISLRHRDFTSGIIQSCNDGVISLRNLETENMNCYSSQLNITYNTAIIGNTIVCAYDNGVNEEVIGRITIEARPLFFPPPTKIRITNANVHQLIFSWSPVHPECSAFHYNIITTNCGICPSTTDHTTVACTGYSTSTMMNNVCSFSVRSVFCGNAAGNMSNPVHVVLRVPVPPHVRYIIPRYSYQTGNMLGFVIQFDTVEPVAISDGIDDSIRSYTIVYQNSESDSSCWSATIPASSCVDDVCRHTFTHELSPCSSISSHSRVNFTILATNVLGNGPASSPYIVKDNISNGFFSVDIDLSSNSVTCTFYNQQNNNKKYCTVAYGPNEESCDSFTQTSYSTSNIVIVGLPSQSLSGTTYCFSVQGNNGSYTAIVEGILSQTDFNKGINNQENVTSCGVAIGLSVMFCILISSIVIIILTVIVTVLVRANKTIRIQQTKAQTMHVSKSTAATISKSKSSTHGIYDDPDGDCAGEIQNLVYLKKDMRPRCPSPDKATVLKDEDDEAYYSTI